MIFLNSCSIFFNDKLSIRVCVQVLRIGALELYDPSVRLLLYYITFLSKYIGAPVAHWFKRWPTDLPIPSSSIS